MRKSLVRTTTSVENQKELRAGPDVSEDIAPCGICNM